MSKRPGLRVEALEGRDVPAATGFPWGNAGHLTLSFAPDGTAVGGETSALTSTFANAPNYKADILRAFQTWAVQANVSIAVTEDDGTPFGATGPTQHDRRFGDIRIAATKMTSETLAISAPHEVFLSGTWAGDVVFNASKAFGPGANDVFAVALHEAGHVLGLEHNGNPRSVMFSHLGNGQTTLSAADIINLRSLYGARGIDPYEKGPSGNNLVRTATRMDLLPQADFDGDVPLAVYGDLRTTADVDHFALVIPEDYRGPVTFRLQTAGVSLLNPSMTVFNGRGQPITGSPLISTKLGGDVLEFTVPNAREGEKYTVRVDGATSDVFGVGTYALAVSLDQELDPQVTDERIDAVLRGPYRSLGQEDLQYLFEDPAYLLNADEGSNETTGTATRLVLPRGYRSPTHFEYLGSLDFVGDKDVYAVRTPAWTRPGAITATIRVTDPAAVPTLSITDRAGNTLPIEVLVNGNGTYTIQASRAFGQRDYFVTVMGGAIGNYTMAVDLTRDAAPVESFATGQTTAAQPNDGRSLFVAESQVFAFVLSATGPAGSAIRMSVIDETGATRFTLTAPAGQTVSGPPVFLFQAGYAVVFESMNGATGYTLRGGGLTIPVGPTLTDPTYKPVFTAPNAPPGQYVYPGDLFGYNPYLAELINRTYGLPTRAPNPAQTVMLPDPYLLLPLVP